MYVRSVQSIDLASAIAVIERVEVMCDTLSKDRSIIGIVVETRGQADRVVGILLIRLLLDKASR